LLRSTIEFRRERSVLFDLPNAALAESEKCLKTIECVVGAIGIEPMTSPV
jgi:hypothetical protein